MGLSVYHFTADEVTIRRVAKVKLSRVSRMLIAGVIPCKLDVEGQMV